MHPTDRHPPRTGPARGRLRAALLPLLLLLATVTTAQAAPDRCQGVPHCRDLGPFTATVVRVNVTRQDSVTAYQGVRTTVRFTNVSGEPLILGYRDRSSAVTDDKGLTYGWSSKATGIGLLARGSADPQFQLAPGASREASFEGTVQYSMRRQVAGSVFSHDITLAQLDLVGGRQVREVRDFLVSFSGLTATSGYGAGAAAAAAPATDVSAGGAGPTAAAAGVSGCAGDGACQTAGAVVARAVRVQTTRSGQVTAYQTVRTTVRFHNAGDRPVILGVVEGSVAVSDDQGHAYRWSSKAHGIGLVGRGGADTQFRLGPGESRDAAFESTLQYNVRHARPGSMFSQDLTVAELAIVGPGQVQTVREHALGFSGLSEGRAGAAVGQALGVSPDALETVNKVVDLLKSLKR